MSAPANMSPLRNLVNILSDAVTQIDQRYASANLKFPALDRPFREEDSARSLLSSPDVIPLASVIVAAADQLIASVRPPARIVLDMSQVICVFATCIEPGRSQLMGLNLVAQHFISPCLRLVCETSVAEILREAGPQVGLHSSPRPRLPFIFERPGSSC